MASLALAAPAVASGGIQCEGGDGVSAYLATGHLPVLQVIGAHVEAGGAAWSTGSERGEGTPFVVGQAFADNQQVLVDFTDPNIEAILVGLRLRFDGSEDLPLTGVLTVGGNSFPVQCGEG
ncbi:hypothetical protein [Devosia ginsengisoli]|uniref:hypothetical protein n=1 Tax=Devosia ginsengisoli TaxID=400770 RepID=UPI0026F2225A|nr:hypothetical protein [Devosia ginsengisoli]MCR6672786.1 hypothetical protein [Devosia ginsengisoli]